MERARRMLGEGQRGARASMAGVTAAGRRRGEGPAAVVDHPTSQEGLDGDSQDSSYLADPPGGVANLARRRRAHASESRRVGGKSCDHRLHLVLMS
jgi:hypothetical protein